MFTTQRLAVRMCFTVLLIGSSPLTGQESERDAGADQLSTVLTSLHQKLGQQPAPSIDTELSALLSLEDDYRGQHVGSMAVWHLAGVARRGGGTGTAHFRALNRFLPHLYHYGKRTDLIPSLYLLSSSSVAPDNLRALDRLIDEEETLPEVLAHSRFVRAILTLDTLKRRETHMRMLERARKANDEELIKTLLDHAPPAMTDDAASQLHTRAERELEHLAQTATELHLVSIRQTDETGYFFTIDADRTSQNRTLARLAAGHLFQHRHLRFGKPGPNLVVTLIDGKTWNLVDHAGKLVLVQFSFKGCAPCERMYPILRELKDEHGDRLEILSIMADEKPETTRDAAQTGKMTWSVCWDGSGGPIVTQWGVEQFPKVYAFGADGTVVAEGIGPEILKEFVDRWAGTSR